MTRILSQIEQGDPQPAEKLPSLCMRSYGRWRRQSWPRKTRADPAVDGADGCGLFAVGWRHYSRKTKRITVRASNERVYRTEIQLHQVDRILAKGAAAAEGGANSRQERSSNQRNLPFSV